MIGAGSRPLGWIVFAACMIVLATSGSHAQARSSLRATASAAAVPDTLVVSLGITSPPDTLLLGEPFELTATIVQRGLRALALLTPKEQLSPFELAGWQRGLDRGDTANVSLILQAFEVGQLMLPPLVVAGETDSGGVCIALGDSLAVEVLSIVPEDATELRDIHEAIALAEPRSLKPWIAAALLLAVLFVAALLFRSRRRVGAVEREFAARPAHEVALDALNALGERDLPDRGPWKAYYTELTAIVRAYLARRFGVDAMDMTTTETLRAVEAVELDESGRDALRAVLRAADAVKFAKATPVEGDSRRHLDEARRFVRLTAPRQTDGAPGHSVAALERGGT